MKEGWDCLLLQDIEEQRAKDKAIWILIDARGIGDLEYFDNDRAFTNAKIIKIRVEASEETRCSGGEFMSGNDDRATECGLDHFENWTYVIDNDCNDQKKLLAKSLKPIFDEVDAVFEKLYNEDTEL